MRSVKPANCNTYGRLYTWDAASVACPQEQGWKLPTRQEWQTLISAVGGDIAGTKLKSRSPAWNGTDDFGFSTLPSGVRWIDNKFTYRGDVGYWWSATLYDQHRAYNVNMFTEHSVVGEYWNTGHDAFSVRCVAD